QGLGAAGHPAAERRAGGIQPAHRQGNHAVAAGRRGRRLAEVRPDMAKAAGFTRRITLAVVVLAGLGAGVARAEDYPTRPVRIIVGFPAGAAGDLVSRVLATHLGSALGQQFIVENRPGASSNIATEYAARAPKDGYMLFLGTVANV